MESVINDVLITQINIRLRSIRVLISVNKGKVIRISKYIISRQLRRDYC